MSDSKVSDHLISGPDFDVTFSAVDQAVPGIYSGRVLIFKRTEGDNDAAAAAIRDGLQKTVDEVPVLAGEMTYDQPVRWGIKKGNLFLRFKQLPELVYDELEATNFSEKHFPSELVSSVPTLMEAHGERHSCRIQTNFITGGVLLVISVHHLVADGWGVTKIIEKIAQNCRIPDNNWTPPASPPLIYADRSRLSATSVPEGEGDIDRIPAYSLVPIHTPWKPTSDKVVITTFRFPQAELAKLKALASPDRVKFPGAWITTHDAVLALWLRTYVRTRFNAGRLGSASTIRFGFPIEFRRQVGLPAEYIGNVFLQHKVDIPLQAILADDGLKNAALIIRQAMKGVGLEYIENYIAVAKSILDVPSISMRLNLKFGERNAAFGCTSYKNFLHGDLDWCPKTFGTYRRLRLPSGISAEGLSVVLPVLKNGDWEMTTMVEEDLLTDFRFDSEWMSFTSDV
ncbi:putative enoyl hydratase isomerase family protein [Rhypophila sp. PSN 637]